MERSSHVFLLQYYPSIPLEEIKKNKKSFKGKVACLTAEITTWVFLKIEHGTKKHLHYAIQSVSQIHCCGNLEKKLNTKMYNN
jgi:hypothetical protein